MRKAEESWTGMLGCIVLPFVLPLALIAIAILNALGLNKLRAKPDYVIGYLEKFIAGDEGDWDWDDFSSIPLTDPILEDIRDRACAVGPWSPGGVDIQLLRELLEEARAFKRASATPCS